MGAVMPWHDSPVCPSCDAPCATPLCRRDTPSDRTFANPSMLWCPACGHSWDEADVKAIAQAWWSIGADEAKRIVEEGKPAAGLPVLSEVAAERARQDSIFGVQRLPDGTGGGGRKTYATIARNWCDRATREGILTFADILDEKTAEALAETDPAKLRVELIQVAAVCLKWAADLDRRALEGGA